jgi:hypothetical protein
MKKIARKLYQMDLEHELHSIVLIKLSVKKKTQLIFFIIYHILEGFVGA